MNVISWRRNAEVDFILTDDKDTTEAITCRGFGSGSFITPASGAIYYYGSPDAVNYERLANEDGTLISPIALDSARCLPVKNLDTVSHLKIECSGLAASTPTTIILKA